MLIDQDFGQGSVMSTLSSPPPRNEIGLITRALGQHESSPLTEVLADGLSLDAFDPHNIAFGIANEDVYTQVVTLQAMISQAFHAGQARRIKGAAGRIMTLIVPSSK